MISLLELINEAHVPPSNFILGLFANGSEITAELPPERWQPRDKMRHKSQYYIK